MQKWGIKYNLVATLVPYRLYGACPYRLYGACPVLFLGGIPRCNQKLYYVPEMVLFQLILPGCIQGCLHLLQVPVEMEWIL